MDMQVTFLDRLFDSGLLIDTGVEGLYARSGTFEDVITGFERLIDKFSGETGAEVIRFPRHEPQLFRRLGLHEELSAARRHRSLLLRR